MATPTFETSAWLDFDAQPGAVRELFFDVDLAVRDKIHRGVRLQWLPRAADGERRLRRHLRVLDKVHVEEVVVEPAPDGAWVQRFVVGPNAGTRFVATFEANEGGGTRVKMTAHPGPHGFAQGLGKLSPLGLEKALKRVLGEYKRAMEGYVPGRAHGAVKAVLAELGPEGAAMRAMDEATRRKAVGALLETAWSIACVDEGPDGAERDTMRALVAALWQTAMSREMEDRMVHAAVEAVQKHGAQARCVALGEKLLALGLGELGVRIAVLMAEVSHGLDPSELDALKTLAQAGGVAEGKLGEFVRHTEQVLSAGDSVERMSTFV
jgi:hypothetical protein